MNYTMTKPCECCPFRRGTPMILCEDRVIEITDNILSRQGGEFPCHRTIEHDDDGEGYTEKPNAQHCAGALIFAEKNETTTQMMRICERIGMYDPAKLMSPENQEAIDSVFADVDEMLEHNLKGMGCAKTTKKSKGRGRSKADAGAAPGAEGTRRRVSRRATKSVRGDA